MSNAYNNEIDCSLVNGSIRVDDQLKGNITAIDIFRVLPYGGSIYKTKIRGSLLKRVLDFGNNAKGTGAYLQKDNVKQVSEEWIIKGKAIDNEQIYTVLFSDYLLKGLDIPFLNERNPAILEIYKPTKNELGFDIRKAVINYLKMK